MFDGTREGSISEDAFTVKNVWKHLQRHLWNETSFWSVNDLNSRWGRWRLLARWMIDILPYDFRITALSFSTYNDALRKASIRFCSLRLLGSMSRTERRTRTCGHFQGNPNRRAVVITHNATLTGFPDEESLSTGFCFSSCGTSDCLTAQRTRTSGFHILCRRVRIKPRSLCPYFVWQRKTKRKAQLSASDLDANCGGYRGLHVSSPCVAGATRSPRHERWIPLYEHGEWMEAQFHVPC